PLLVGSPAIDAYSAPCTVNRDQLGMIRPSGDKCDGGATEFVPEGTVILSEPQSITLSDCTGENFYETVNLLNWAGGDISLDCPANTIIPFNAIQTIYAPLVITSQTSIRLVGDGHSQLFIVDASADLTLIGMLIEGGMGTNGGAIENYGALTLHQMTFTTNQAVWGGAVYNNGMLIIENSQFSENYAQVGGAIYNNSVLTSTDSTYINNIAERQSEDKFKPFRQEDTIANPAIGGAIYTNNSLTVTNSRFELNNATDSGGAIGNDGAGEMTITDSQFIGNSANKGGAVAHASSEERERLYDICDCGFSPYIYITQSHFEENQAVDGGAIYNALIMQVNKNLFVGNVAQASGGAIYNEDETYVYENTFFENHADKGGAIFGYVINGSQNTFVRNSAISEGGAIHSSRVYFSTFVDNTAPLGGAIFSSSATASIIWGYSMQCYAFDKWDSANHSISNRWCDEAQVVDDMRLGEFDGWVVPLLPDSPAIDAYDCDGNYIEPLRDQLGTPRPQGEKCDVGAVEFVPDAP
ncbi:MAG TPA: choice-of-anchor Q domain-containing protein, partial [Aggregatilineales bacterium]|nr:choice-of-anchor Q domain-containing protein [Aggregatilineales bacterium]